MKKEREIYLDYASATPIDPSVLRSMLPYLKKYFGNPSSIHLKGTQAHQVLEDARRETAFALGVKSENIIFTGSGTESDNLAIFGIAKSYKNEGKHIVISKIEHKAVLEPAQELERQGYDVTYLDVDENGLIDLGKLKSVLREDTILVSIIYANNEVGVIQPIRKIASIIKEHRNGKKIPFFHTDACQAAGAVGIGVSSLGVDLMTLNGSKIYGPKGVGCLYASQEVRLSPIILGGGQENEKRAGTENLSLIVGFSEALKLAEKLRKKESARLIELREYFISETRKRIDRVELNGHKKKRLPNNINVSFSGVEGESIMLMLDNEGIAVSTGSACTSKSLESSHVLAAMFSSKERMRGSIRITLGRSTTKKDLDYVLGKLVPIIKKLRQISISST